jgi:methylated-DNA-[protein]-cysteine S-methyltransferase
MRRIHQASAYTAVMKTPVGKIGVITANGRLCAIDFLTGSARERKAQDPTARKVVAWLSAYFDNAREPFSVPLEMEGTGFQKAVWKQLCKIKPGRVRTYGDIARILNSSPRAVGNACRANPLPIIVPCHRVVSAQGIGGYGGKVRGSRLEQKRWLLSLEGVVL